MKLSDFRILLGHKNRLTRRVLPVLAAGFSLILQAVSPGVYAYAVNNNNGNPQGSNGDVKIHAIGTSTTDQRNEPHVCQFYIEGFNFDNNESGQGWIEAWSPSDNHGSIVYGKFTWSGSNWRQPPSGSISLPDGHYKLFWSVSHSTGSGKIITNEKHKVFWVSCEHQGGPPPSEEKGHLTVTKVLIPSNDPGKFNLQIDSVTYATNVGDGGSATREVSPGQHSVGESAGTGTDLNNYSSHIGGDCSSTGVVNVGANQSKTCTITNIRKSVGGPGSGVVNVTKYNDANNNQKMDAGEAVLSGWQIELSGNGIDQTMTTGNSGSVSFSVPVGDDYNLFEHQQSGWTLSDITCSDNQGINNSRMDESDKFTVKVTNGLIVNCTIGNIQTSSTTPTNSNNNQTPNIGGPTGQVAGSSTTGVLPNTGRTPLSPLVALALIILGSAGYLKLRKRIS